MLAIVFAGLGGGNSSRVEYAPALFQFDRLNENVAYRPEYDLDLAPAPVVLVAPQIEATPTAPLPAAAIAPMVTAAAIDGGDRPQCPAVIVATFGEHAPAACAIAWCESRYNPLASGDGGVSLGLFQVNTGWHGPSGPNGWASWAGIEPEALYDPAVNADVARRIWAYSGYTWRAWTCAAKVGLS